MSVTASNHNMGWQPISKNGKAFSSSISSARGNCKYPVSQNEATKSASRAGSERRVQHSKNTSMDRASVDTKQFASTLGFQKGALKEIQEGSSIVPTSVVVTRKEEPEANQEK